MSRDVRSNLMNLPSMILSLLDWAETQIEVAYVDDIRIIAEKMRSLVVVVMKEECKCDITLV